jgi:hypothetical protein
MTRLEIVLDRLFKSGIITTLLALVIIMTGVTCWAFGKVDASEVAIIAAVATPLLFLKDKNIGING